MNSPDTLIVGYPGRLARAFAWLWPQARRVGRADFDLADRAAVLRVVGALAPRRVINCAALTDVALCEREPDLAWRVNVRGVRHLSEACRLAGAVFVHFSSDYALAPVNEYGWTKRASEALADLVLRAKLYDASHWAWDALRRGRPVQLLTNEYCNPLSVTGAARLTAQLLQAGRTGLIALGTQERLSLFQVGRAWAEVLGAPPSLVQPRAALDSPYPRPADTYLDPAGQAALGLCVPALRADARQHLEAYAAYGPPPEAA